MKKMNIMRKLNLALSVMALMCHVAPAQEKASVSLWYGDKKCAVSYTFDDLTSNQLPVAMPIFDNYNYKMTFNVVTNWTSSASWSSLASAARNNHEVACHTVSHASLGSLSINKQNEECANAVQTIEANVTSAKCLTIAYPNCVTGDIPTLQKYFIGGRICDGQIERSTPSDFYNISSIICGDQGSAKTSDNLTSKVQSARATSGWCVFLFHGIDNDQGYSPIASSALSTHLAYIHQNEGDYWVATFRDAIQYIKERDNAQVTESVVSSDEIAISVTDGLDDNKYYFPLTMKRKVPDGWTEWYVQTPDSSYTPAIFQENGADMFYFNIVPDGGTVTLVSTPKVVEKLPLRSGWNIIGYPYEKTVSIEDAFSHIGDTLSALKNEDSFFLPSNTGVVNSLDSLHFGKGYMIRLTDDCNFVWPNL